MIRAPSDSLTEGLSDASPGKPEGDGSDDDHRSLVERAFLVARRQPTPLFQAVDAPLHDVATFVNRLAVSQGATGPERTSRPLIAPLGNGVPDVPLPQQPTTARVAVALVSDKVVGPRAGPAALTGGVARGCCRAQMPIGSGPGGVLA